MAGEMHTATTRAGGVKPGDDAAEAEESASKEGSADRAPLLAAICHDLRAPLAAVTMGATFVLQTTANDDANARPRRVLEAVLRSCKHMERLIRDFGDLSEIEADLVALRLGVHEAGEVLEIAASSARPRADERKVRIEVTHPEAPLPVRCDRERLLRALSHLLENASRFAPEGSVVSLAVREVDGEAYFTVTDSGPGFSKETLEHLYDRTWHAKHGNRVGAGLGLAIVRGLVRAHGGRLTVGPQQQPTTVSFVVPQNGPEGVADEEEAPATT